MAVKQIVSKGIGFDQGQIGFLLTKGLGNFTVSGTGGLMGLVQQRRRRGFIVLGVLLCLMVL